MLYIAIEEKKTVKKTDQLSKKNTLDIVLESQKSREKEKKKVYIETNEHIKNRVKIFEDRENKNKSEKEKLDYRKKIYEQNRANARERMRKLKNFLRDKNDMSKTDEEFFENNKEFFAQYGVKSYYELLKLIHNYDKENPEELEREIKEKFKKNLKIENQLFGEGKNGFSIIPKFENKFQNLKIDSSFLPEKLLSNKNCKIFNKNLQECQEIKEYIIPDIKKYFKEKMKLYEVNNLTNEGLTYPAMKKTIYNPETDLIVSSNIINIFIEKIPNKLLSKGENYSQNGIPINELLDAKIKKILGRLSDNDKNNYEKVQDIINNLDNNKNKNLYKNVLGNNFCINCDKSFDNKDPEQCSFHSEHNFIQIDKNIANDLDEKLNVDINELDYNNSLNKIYQNLKKEQNKVLKYGKKIVINFYSDLLFHLYEIIVNNNSIEDLNESIIKINELYKTNIEPQEGIINEYFKKYFFFYVIRITKLSYNKLKKIEKLLADLLDVNEDRSQHEETDIIEDTSDIENQYTFFKTLKVKKNEFNNIFEDDLINLDNNKQLEGEGNKKYFLRLGLDLKFKYGKNESIHDLYNKAKEKGIEPNYYETFILEELNVTDKKN